MVNKAPCMIDVLGGDLFQDHLIGGRKLLMQVIGVNVAASKYNLASMTPASACV